MTSNRGRSFFNSAGRRGGGGGSRGDNSASTLSEDRRHNRDRLGIEIVLGSEGDGCVIGEGSQRTLCAWTNGGNNDDDRQDKKDKEDGAEKIEGSAKSPTSVKTFGRESSRCRSSHDAAAEEDVGKDYSSDPAVDLLLSMFGGGDGRTRAAANANAVATAAEATTSSSSSWTRSQLSSVLSKAGGNLTTAIDLVLGGAVSKTESKEKHDSRMTSVKKDDDNEDDDDNNEDIDLARAMRAVIRAREKELLIEDIKNRSGASTLAKNDSDSEGASDRAGGVHISDPSFGRIHKCAVRNGLSSSEVVSFLEGYRLHRESMEEMKRTIAEMGRELTSLRSGMTHPDPSCLPSPSSTESSSSSSSSSSKIISLIGGGSGAVTREDESLKDSAKRVNDLLKKVSAVPAPMTFSGEGSRLPMRMIQEDELFEEEDNDGISSSVNDLRDALKLTKTKKRVVNQSCKRLSIKRILNDPNVSPDTERVLRELMEVERKQKKLEKQLQQAGVSIAEDIPYEEAKAKVREISRKMQEIGSSNVTHEDKLVERKLREEYFKLEQEMEKYNNALMLTEEYIQEQEEQEKEWEESNAKANLKALKKIRRHMPVDVKNISEAQLCTQRTPNGKVLPKDIAKKFKRTDVLMILRTDPNEIERVHPSTLENLRVTGLTLTERRAIHSHLCEVAGRWKTKKKDGNKCGAETSAERKWTWFNTMRENFKLALAQYEAHAQKYGPPEKHPYATQTNPNVGCPLIGRQCPIRADGNPSYDNDYGYPDGEDYVESFVVKAGAAVGAGGGGGSNENGAAAQRDGTDQTCVVRDKARAEDLKRHYRGNVLDVSLAMRSCEEMDECMDKMESQQIQWIQDRVKASGAQISAGIDLSQKEKELAAFHGSLKNLKMSIMKFAEKAGMQLRGKRDVTLMNKDNRSVTEIGLCEEVYEAAIDFLSGIEERMGEMKNVDGRSRLSVKQLISLLQTLHDQNLETLKTLGCARPSPSRTRKTRRQMLLLVERRRNGPAGTTATNDDASEKSAAQIRPLGGRGALLAAIAGRGHTSDNGGRKSQAIAVGKSNEARSNGGFGRAVFLGVVAERRGRNEGRMMVGYNDTTGIKKGITNEEGGRGGFLAEIKNRGGRAGHVGTREDLATGDARRDQGGGHNDLLAEIAARGRARQETSTEQE